MSFIKYHRVSVRLRHSQWGLRNLSLPDCLKSMKKRGNIFCKKRSNQISFKSWRRQAIFVLLQWKRRNYTNWWAGWCMLNHCKFFWGCLVLYSRHKNDYFAKHGKHATRILPDHRHQSQRFKLSGSIAGLVTHSESHCDWSVSRWRPRAAAKSRFNFSNPSLVHIRILWTL